MGLPIRFPSADQLRQGRRSLEFHLSDNCRSDLMRGYSAIIILGFRSSFGDER